MKHPVSPPIRLSGPPTPSWGDPMPVERLRLAADRLQRMARTADQARAYELAGPLLNAARLLRSLAEHGGSAAARANVEEMAAAILGDLDQEPLT